jgi:hypothetical protein
VAIDAFFDQQRTNFRFEELQIGLQFRIVGRETPAGDSMIDDQQRDQTGKEPHARKRERFRNGSDSNCQELKHGREPLASGAVSGKAGRRQL